MGERSYLVSARKHRPMVFEEVIGQGHITRTLEQGIASGKHAQAMLFCGPRGVGKTSCARIFARALNNFEPTEATSNGALNIFELDAASNNSVEDIRRLIEQVRFPPQQGSHKVYIIDEVHMLSQQAFNAFLKTLEEPPAYAVFILATTEKQKILPTILSRCQVHHFKRISVADIVGCLQKIAERDGHQVEEAALYEMARQADGALRDALSLFDLMVTFCAGEPLSYERLAAHMDLLAPSYFFELTACLRDGKLGEGLVLLDEIVGRGVDLHHMLLAWAKVLRDLLLAKDTNTKRLVELGAASSEQYEVAAKDFESSFLMKALDVLNEGEQGYRNSHQTRLHVELLLVKIAGALESNKAFTASSAEKKKP